MTNRMNLFVAIVVGAAAWLLAAILVGPASCRDGWSSPSIGRSGACSHHGGVATSSTILFGLIAGFAAYFVAKTAGQRGTDAAGVISPIGKDRRSPPDLAEWGNPACPLCGKGMVRTRLVDGEWMLTCSQFPSCQGFIDPIQKKRDAAA
jgi:hypothetical protein